MNRLDLTLPSPSENLAFDEALLDFAESSGNLECLRFWESSSHFVVLGYANHVGTEVNQAACERLHIPILRRCSGGGPVLQGPGVLNYTLILGTAGHNPVATVTSANQFIMQRNADALSLQLGQTVEVQGHTDLTIGSRKFSGNAQRRKRTHLLFHGALLLNLDMELLDQVLPLPSLQPGYRQNRSHREFLLQLGVLSHPVKQALRNAWSADHMLDLDRQWPNWREDVRLRVAEKYSRAEWNLRI
jgi:lipoate-protein ligase A